MWRSVMNDIKTFINDRPLIIKIGFVTFNVGEAIVEDYLGFSQFRIESWRIACLVLHKTVHFIRNDHLYDSKSISSIQLYLESSVYYLGTAIWLNWGCSAKPRLNMTDHVACGYSFIAWRNGLVAAVAASLTLYKLAISYNVVRVLLRKVDHFAYEVIALTYSCFCFALQTILSDYVTIGEESRKAGAQYQHTPLQEGEIRVLKVHRRFPFSALRTTIIQMTLEQAPPYEAISYTWGTTRYLREICVNNQPYSTSIATYDAIYSRSSMWRSRIIWIDYLCVNQQNLEEKAAQVARMMEIYERASRVIVCLGRPKGSFRAFMVLHQLLLTQQAKWTPTRMYRWYKFKAGEFKDDFVALLNHPWFTRVWIIQEVAVAQEVQISYGCMVYDWFDFIKVVDIFKLTEMSAWLNSTKAGIRAQSNLARLDLIQAAHISHAFDDPFFKRFRHIFSKFFSESGSSDSCMNTQGINTGEFDFDSGTDHHIDKDKEEEVHMDTLSLLGPLVEQAGQLIDKLPKARSLPYLLCAHAEFQATDPRDKVYALRGLVSDKGDTLAKLKLDYSRPVEDLYLQVATMAWSDSDPFKLISYAGIGHGESLKLPSWVPDWTLTSRPKPLTLPIPHDFPGVTPANPNFFVPVELVTNPFTAGGSAEPQISFDVAHPKIITIAGNVIDEVVSLSVEASLNASGADNLVDSGYGMAYDREQWKEMVTWHEECLALVETALKDRTSKERTNQLWRTLICDSTKYRRPAPASVLEDYLIFVKRLKKAKDLCFNGGSAAWIAGEEHQRQRDLLIPFATDLGRGCINRKLCATQRSYIGLVPRKSRVGDIVFIAQGAPTPWLLRPAPKQNHNSAGANGPDKYLLVGDCYIHGIMDGEKWDPDLSHPVCLV